MLIYNISIKHPAKLKTCGDAEFRGHGGNLRSAQ